jgi:hypothetical protein
MMTGVKKFHRRRNRALAYSNIQEQPFPLFQYCGIGDLPGVASEAQTNEVQRGEVRIIGLQDYSM